MLVLLCGGQGVQSAGMFDLIDGQPEAVEILGKAADLLGHDPRDLVRIGDRADLLTNRTNQILAVCAALATHACIAPALPGQLAVAGYSVGEMAAWAIAGVWSNAEALRLTDCRARAMDAAGGSDGQLGYIRGLGRPAVESLVQRHGCAIAIVNPDKLFVVGGDRPAVTQACREAATSGTARAALLEVRIASHTPHLANAVEPFRQALVAATWGDPDPRRKLISGSDGSSILKTSSAIGGLAARVARPLDWAATLESLGELGATRVLDLGPGHALAEMARVALPNARSYAASAFRTIDGLREWVVAR
jgi:[acyl-carrier-protein] S-malonyltransferase